MQTDTGRTEVQRLLRHVPFQPFALNLDNGDCVVIAHPENIAFEPVNGESLRSRDFYVISADLRVFSTFDAVTSVALVDLGE